MAVPIILIALMQFGLFLWPNHVLSVVTASLVRRFPKNLENTWNVQNVVIKSRLKETKKNHNALLAQLDRVAGFEPVGREFESLRARQNKPLMKVRGFLFSADLYSLNLNI